MFKKMLLIILGFSMIAGGFWALKAQDTTPQKQTTMKPAPATATAQTVQTDLSGTYAGTFNCDALGLTGDTTLTITGNEFTTSDGKTGRIVASTTHGYTAVALQVGSTATAPTATTPAPMETPMIVSMRARKSGSRLTLTSVPGAMHQCSFTPGRNIARGRRNRTAPTATGTEVSSPATVPAPTESPMPAQTPTPSPTPRRSPRPRPTPTPSASPTPSPEPMPSPTPPPEPVPSPTPSPEPVPSPTPGGSPTPTEPTPSPTPTPSPSPSPSPRG
ncbi:MAG TPA: hypothetical protein VJ875_27260 [Pyrinomonadaceae bacterium]|nr:hypothetical protein [Pyrinomonadaceae bacterium]